MNRHITQSTKARGTWLWLSIAAACLAVAGNVVALSDRSIYAGLTRVFLPQALAQDIANLAVVAPAWLLLAALALRGSMWAYLLWLGVLTFTVYNYVIYTFAVPFGPLFLLWVAVRGIRGFALIGGALAVDHQAVAASFASRRATTVVAWLLIVIALLFGLLWLSEDVPALVSGTRPRSVSDMNLPTNPVHVLDLAFILPSAVPTGVQLLRRRPFAHTLPPAFLVFLVLTGVPILLTPVVQAAGGAPAAWSIVGPIGTLTVALSAVLAWLLATVRPPQPS